MQHQIEKKYICKKLSLYLSYDSHHYDILVLKPPN